MDDDVAPEGESPLEKFKNLSCQRQRSILVDHEMFCASLTNAMPWPFMTYEITTISFKIPGFSDLSTEEVRLAFYLSFGSELFKTYEKYMTQYYNEYKHNVEIILSNDFVSLLSGEFEWSNTTDRLSYILNKCQLDSSSNFVSIHQIDEKCENQCQPNNGNKSCLT